MRVKKQERCLQLVGHNQTHLQRLFQQMIYLCSARVRISLLVPFEDCADTFADVGTRHSMGLAIQIYPMYENGFRAHRSQTQKENNHESAQMYAAFDEIACAHPHSWRSGETPRNAADIGNVANRNRLICSPCKISDLLEHDNKLIMIDPLLMNAFNTVNLAAACILTSVEHATALGIPRSKWIYVLGGAGTEDKENCKHQANKLGWNTC